MISIAKEHLPDRTDSVDAGPGTDAGQWHRRRVSRELHAR